MDIKEFEKRLRDLNELMPIESKDKQTIELKPGVWNGVEMSAIEYVPANAPDSYKIYRRLYTSFLNRRAIFESLFYSAGGINYDTYKAAMEEIERGLKSLEKFYNYKSVALLVINQKDNPVDKLHLFNDIYLCGHFTENNLGVTTEQIQANDLPDYLKGTRIYDQEWHTSKEMLISNYPSVNNLSDDSNDDGMIDLTTI